MSINTHNLFVLNTHIVRKIDIWPVASYKQIVTRDPLYKQIGAVIKARRKTLGLKQETLAAKLGISRGSLASVETGRQNVLVHQLFKFAAALELMPIDLLPAPSNEQPRTGHSELPLPDDLKAQQRVQIARLFEQVNTDPVRVREGSRAKTSKR